MKNANNLVSIALGVCCLLLGVALVGAYSGDKDTRLKDMPHITNNNYHIAPNADLPALDTPELNRPTIPVSVPIHSAHQPIFRVSNDPAPPEPRILYVEQPRPDPVPDTTIVVYKPEIRQPVQKVVVIDERYERLKSEHEARMQEWTSGPVVVVR